MLPALCIMMSLATQGPSPQQILEGGFSGAVRAYAVNYLGRMPPSEFSNNWDNKISVDTPDGGHWEWEGVKSHWVTHYRHNEFNHGLWNRGWVRVENPQQELILNIGNFRNVPGHFDISFDVFVRLLARGHVEVREYNHGVELFAVDSDMRAVGKVSLTLRVYLYDNATRLGWQVTSSNVEYSDVVVDRIGQIQGYAARVIGDAASGGFNQFFGKKKEDMINNCKQSINDALNGSLPIRDEVASVIRLLSR